MLDAFDYNQTLRDLQFRHRDFQSWTAKLEASLPRLSVVQRAGVLVAVAERSWLCWQESGISAEENTPARRESDIAFARNLPVLIERAWEWIDTGTLFDDVLSDLAIYDDRFWEDLSAISEVFYLWLEDPYRAPIPAVLAGAGRLSQYMESVPRSVLSGRDEWRKQTFTRPDVARRGEMMLMAWCSPQSLIAYEWVARDVEFAAACEDPGDLPRLRPHLAREIEMAIRWNEELTEVEIPLDGPLGDEPVWPEEAAQRIRREADELAETF